MKVLPTLVLSAVLVAGLAGCSVQASAGVTIPDKQIAAAAAKALKKAVNSSVTPKIDCGPGSTLLKVGKKLDCTLTDPGNGEDYATVVTITKVKGLDYSVDAKVASTPKS